MYQVTPISNDVVPKEIYDFFTKNGVTIKFLTIRNSSAFIEVESTEISKLNSKKLSFKDKPVTPTRYRNYN